MEKSGRTIKSNPKKDRRRKQFPAATWWWTPSRGGKCHDCGEHLPKFSRIAYCHDEQAAICEICADNRGVVPRESRAWKKQRAA